MAQIPSQTEASEAAGLLLQQQISTVESIVNSKYQNFAPEQRALLTGNLVQALATNFATMMRSA